MTRIFNATKRAGRTDLEALEPALRSGVLAGGAKALEAFISKVGVGRRDEKVRLGQNGYET